MIARAESSQPRPADVGGAFVLAAAAVGLFLLAWAGLHVGFYTRDEIQDTPLYESYAERIVDGEVPYRDFEFEYPPLAIPVLALPELVGDDYLAAFELEMAVLGALMVALLALTLRALRASAGRTALALAFAALFPLLLGSVVLTRFDLWPSALTAAALAALLAGRLRLGHGVLGLAAAAKLYPALLLPLTLAYVWWNRGRAEAVRCASIFAAVLAGLFLPFLLVAPGGIVESLARQLSRPLQIESLGAAVLLAAHQLFGIGLELESSHGSQNLVGAAPVVLAVLLALVQLGVLVAIWLRLGRRPLSAESLVLGAAAVLVAFVALGKVFSPQFLIWLVPIVPLVAGRRGVGAGLLLGVAMVTTQVWFPYRYWDLVLEFDAAASWLVLLRDLVLVALLLVLLRGTERELPRSS
jgi:Glycosyltransferase family 87